MNTIIYVYRGRDSANFKIEKLDEPDYCLIRLGLPTPLWKNLKQLDKDMQDKQENELTDGNSDKAQEPAGKPTAKECLTEGSIPFPALRKRRISKRVPPKRQRYTIFRKKEHSIPKRRRGARRNAARDGLKNAENNYVEPGRGIVERNILQEESEGVRENPLMSAEEECKEAQKQEVLRKEALRQQITALLGELETLQTALCLLGGNTYWTYTVYEERFRTKIDTPSWWNAWEIPEFENYSQPLWAEKILPHGDCPNLLILGQSDCIPGLLVTNARRMRSVKWYLLQREYTQETEEFIDIFYEEYGLVIEVHLLEEKKNWWRVCFRCPEPVKVLDFSGEAKVSAYGVAKGSIWLDMNAMDEKAMRMEVRNQGISYFSLKKLWGGLQKPVNDLDTLVKNRYNT